MDKQAQATLFSSQKQDWGTPDHVFDQLNRTYRFTLDAAASAENTKCERFIDEAQDAFKTPWTGRVWLNPPYGRALARWVERAFEQSQSEDVEHVVVLIPARTDTRYWHDFVMRSHQVFLVKGRIRFEGAPASAPFPSAIVVFRKHDADFPEFRPLVFEKGK